MYKGTRYYCNDDPLTISFKRKISGYRKFAEINREFRNFDPQSTNVQDNYLRESEKKIIRGLGGRIRFAIGNLFS